MAIDYVALKAELTNDPLGLDYSGRIAQGDHSGLRRLLNAPVAGATTDVQEVSVDDIRDALVFAEVVTLPAGQRDALMLLLSGSTVRVTQRTKDAFSLFFGVGTQTRANLLALITRGQSRAEQLFGPGTIITLDDVRKARGS